LAAFNIRNTRSGLEPFAAQFLRHFTTRTSAARPIVAQQFLDRARASAGSARSAAISAESE